MHGVLGDFTGVRRNGANATTAEVDWRVSNKPQRLDGRVGRRKQQPRDQNTTHPEPGWSTIRKSMPPG